MWGDDNTSDHLSFFFLHSALEAFKYRATKRFHTVVIAIQELASHTIGDDEADGKHMMPEQVAEPINGRAFHLHIGYGSTLVVERFDFAIQFGVFQAGTNISPLWTKKARGAYCDTLGHIVPDTVKQFLGCRCAIGIR